jgi:hypothetical protein
MIDLRGELRSVDQVPAPDLTDDVWAKVATPRRNPLLDEGVQGRGTRGLLVAAAGIIVLIVAVVGWMTLRNSDDPVRAGADASWLTGNGTTQGSCVEQFSVDALASRSWAFDGTITEVVPAKDLESGAPEDIVTSVTFRVDRWYKGGSGDTVTVKTYNIPGVQASNEGPDPSVGARILASGEDDYIWGCGFSKPFSEENAGLFAQAFDS